MNQISTPRRTGAGVAVGALVASALLFAPPAHAADPTVITSVRESDIAKDATVKTGWYQALEAGQPKVITGGLELVGPSRVIKGFADSDNSVDSLAKIAGANFVAAPGPVSLQVPVSVDLDGAGSGEPVLTTLSSAVGTGKVVETTDLWTSSEAFGTIAANDPKPLSEIIAAATIDGATHKVQGFGVDAATGTSLVSSITFDGTQYLFGNTAPVVRDVSVSTKLNTPVNVALAATDADGNALKYTVTSVTNGTLTATGTERTFTPTKNYSGNAVVKYTVDDERGGSASATIAIKVKKLATKVTIYRVNPVSGKITTKSKVKVYAAISIDGKAAPAGTVIYGYAKGKKVTSGKVNKLGKVKLSLPNKLPKGKSTLKVQKVGSKTLSGSTASISVRIKK